MEGLGLSGATKRVADHAREFVRLELQLAAAEVKRRLQAVGTGIGLTFGAVVLALFALWFGLAAAAAGLATTLPVWASLLIVCGAVALIGAIIGYIGVRMLQKNANPVPEQAVEEARLTAEALQNGDGVDDEGTHGAGA